MAESTSIAAKKNQGGGVVPSWDESCSNANGGKGDQLRMKAAQQKERLEALCRPVVRRHSMKDLTKVGVRLIFDSMSQSQYYSPESKPVLLTFY